MLPLRDANPRLRFPLLTLALIATNVAIFLLWQPTLDGGRNPELENQTFFWCHGLVPYEITHGTALSESGSEGAAAIEEDYPQLTDGSELQTYLGDECPEKDPWLSVLTSMFLHGGWLHLAGNMLFLWVFGDNVEDALGKVGFLIFYLAAGLAASVLPVVLGPGSTIPNVGASGAIAGVLGAYLYLFPHSRVLTAVMLVVFWSVIELPAGLVLGAWFVLQFFQGVAGLASQVNGGVSYGAHVGGFVFGYVIALVFLRGRRQREMSRSPFLR